MFSNMYSKCKMFVAKHSKSIAVAAVAVFAGAKESFATYADVPAVVTAVQGTVDTGTTTFLSAAAIGVGVLTIGIVVYTLRKGVKLR